MNEKRYNLIILDDYFPNLLSAFRIAEFNYYLKKIKNSIVYSKSYQYNIHIKKYETEFKQFRRRVFKFGKQKVLNAKLIYLVFINNVFKFLKFIEKNQTSFIFTLYPGGGFKLIHGSIRKEIKKIFSFKAIINKLCFPILKAIKNHKYKNFLPILKDFGDSYIDKLKNMSYIDKLKNVFSSPFFRKVIVTQKISYNYLIKNKLCKNEDIYFLYGGVLPSDKYYRNNELKLYYPYQKKTFDICFVAAKYMDKGLDKGYDIFIEVAKILCKQYNNIYFHVVGGFNEWDIDTSEIKNNIKFYGFLETPQFGEFFRKQDIILSPNKPFAREPGTFDGFPTGSCIEASFNSVALFVSDVLNQNIIFKNEEDIVIIPNDPHQIALKINFYYENPKKLYNLARKGKNKSWKRLNIEVQMKKRINLLSKYLNINSGLKTCSKT